MFSQNNEEEIILKYFGGFKGALLSLGENNGKTFSNSRQLLLNDWSGVLIEPTSAFATLQDLYRFREDVKCLNVAVGNETKKGILHQCLDTLVSSAYDENKAIWGADRFTDIEVDFYSFADLLKLADCFHFDFITIDCEGSDMGILRQIDLNAIGCKCICIEYGNYLNEMRQYCTNFGMRELAVTNENLIMAR